MDLLKITMQKLNLFLDSLKRLSLKQTFFLGYNKIIKKKLYPLILYINGIRRKPKIKTQFADVINNITGLIGTENIWQAGINNYLNHSEYYNELKQNIIYYADRRDIGVIKGLWNKTEDDVELNYNYQRFYLFNEIFTELRISDEIKIELILGWINNNTNVKLAWSGFNCAIRLINWMKILADIDSTCISTEQWEIIERSIYLQHKFNKTNIEHHIPGNHVLFQYYSEWLIAIIFSKWVDKYEEKKIFDLLLTEFNNEFLDSGLHFELSSHYHLQITLIALYLFIHLQNLNRKIPSKLTSIINRAVDIVHKFMIGEYYVMIGDSCYNFFHESKKEDLENLLFLEGRIPKHNNAGEKLSVLNDQYIILNNKNFHLIFDTGEIGLRQNPGHGHADILSFILGYKGEPIFVDPGTKRYSNNISDLELKRSSLHNTISVNNSDQAKLWGFFRWAYLPNVFACNHETTSSGSIVLEGSYEGFYDLGGIKHKRRISIGTDDIIIEDNLKGKIKNLVQLNFILHPDIKYEEQGQNIILYNKMNKFIVADMLGTDVLVEIEDQLIYDSYNTPTPSKKMVFTYTINSLQSFKSMLSIKVLN